MNQDPKRELLRFFGLAFAWSWPLFTVAALHLRTHGTEGAAWWAYLALLLGAYGPSLIALRLTARTGGKKGVGRLLKGFLAWRGIWPHHVASVLLLPALLLLALPLYLLLGGGSAAFDPSRAALIPIALVAALPFGPLAEEIGWRGFAQPRLLERWSPLATGAVLGTAWTGWHLPLFFSPVGTSISGEPVTLGSVSFYWGLLVGLSILIAWLGVRSGAHLLTGLLVHLGFNAEILRLVIEFPDGGLAALERWALVPVWLLVAWLAASGRLRSVRSR